MISAETESGYKIEIPSIFNDYIIIKYEGNGWSSVVFKVRKKKSNKFYAAKIISKADMINKNSLDDVINEINIHKALNHPHVVKIYEELELTNSKNEEFIIIIQEYCSKGNLITYLNQNGIKNKQERKKIEFGIIDGIKYLHGIGYAHGDIKPENILIDKNNNAKLSDFSFCQYYSNDNSIFFKSDIWSIGIILYTLSEGKEPNITLNKNGHIQIRMEDIKLKKLIQKCTALSLEKRPSIEKVCNDEYFLTSDDEENISNSIIENSYLDFSYLDDENENNQLYYSNEDKKNSYLDFSINIESLIDLKQSKISKKFLKKSKRSKNQRKQHIKIKHKKFNDQDESYCFFNSRQ